MGPQAGGEPGSGPRRAGHPRTRITRAVRHLQAQVAVPLRVRRRRLRKGLHNMPHAHLHSRGAHRLLCRYAVNFY